MTGPSIVEENATRFARVAFEAAAGGDWARAVELIQRIDSWFGGEGLTWALITWCDIYGGHATGGRPVRVRARRVHMMGADGALVPSDDPSVPHAVRWAGRTLVARMERDAPRWVELMEELDHYDDREAGRCVLAVLQTAVMTTGTLPEGFAMLGALFEEEAGPR